MRKNKEKKEKTRYTLRVSQELSEFIDSNADIMEITSAEFIRSAIKKYRETLKEVAT